MPKLKFNRHPVKKGVVKKVKPKKIAKSIDKSIPRWDAVPISESKQNIDSIIDKKFNLKNTLSEQVDKQDKPSSSTQSPHQPTGTSPNQKMPSKEDMGYFVVNEAKEGINWTRASLYLSAFGIVGIIFFSQMANEINPVFVILIWLFGMMAFLPLGFIGGWLFLDPYMRCKLMRRLRGKNYGIVNFLHKGGQRITTRIKNLDDDVIIENGRMWLLDREGIQYIDKNNEKKLWKKIDVEHMKTLPADVPSLFLDTETMSPIKFVEQPSKTNPQQAGAVILGYINNQVQKNSMLKKGSTILFIIILAVAVLSLVISLQLYNWVEEMHNVLPALRHQISTMSDLLAQYNPPTP